MTGHLVRGSYVSLTLERGVAQLRLARAEANNALNDELVHGLASALTELESSDARATLICADGPHLTVGGDLGHLAAQAQVDRLADELEEIVPVYHDVLCRLAALEIPVVCAARGVVGGGGLGLVWCADVVIASTDLRLVTGFAGLGLSGDGGSSWALPRLVGQRRARQLMLLGRHVDAEQALAWGLVERVIEPDQLQAEAEAEACRLAQGPTVAYGHIKRLLRASAENSFAEQLDAERAAMVACARTDDAREGILGFAGRRRPDFKGR